MKSCDNLVEMSPPVIKLSVRFRYLINNKRMKKPREKEKEREGETKIKEEEEEEEKKEQEK